MERIEKRDGKVYIVTGEKGFETYHYAGLDPDYLEKPKKRKKNKKPEDE